ncbi:1-(5-phosphoribosyl)-5-[(5-phosphoribosylamino)methylideneamino]imidazole-4-carboxamide isomerase [Phaeodactylibacter sp.]|jgi:phosphoribosylformimino-5-aminoimidazole carboxamide ribotide isomerase|uniref:1-(5-phosphoribosyl)-5-[(5- phosphoribosylamino)methylideneamino]imidazole-4- carboxamide isomerase n=1 Tax=Phaeodactylibacter sp. TaxID=1940289 RepID=UPI0025EEF0CA|nr:1-(5-phosphoribosyl)-5-[(5-phosphoribosylamino)methylideneamino]imidazole-4-carboxamide isomerase [Phaeodactylibacter sp.]MCI4648275.1 1-(5-phosphoribosyl)-5-[(5-phosphoribosylamino)methylideneamino]imidazole-4-carboxamide isomerase [Phaeodactylibacter sp.]MCI5091870.1 1-(5-phosphoribosyl)-5-[(5-phosphoribosylamino)methylideneamino]imidazole-4-carboxamide isomerase [Phaeodactylibacter sp.]
MHPIPAIDIIEGKCVRLTQGDYDRKKVYNEDPLEVAKAYEAHGLQRLHLVDLDGAKAKQIVNYKVLETLATKTHLHIDFGGGLKSDEDLRVAFDSGAKQVTGGTIAVKQPAVFEAWLQRFGAERIILGSDVKDGKIAVSGWQEQSEQELFPFLESYIAKGIRYTICTDVSKDGLLEGTALPLYKDIRSEFTGLQLIASGGISSLDELDELRDIGCFGAIIGKAIYENKISLQELEQWVLKS